MLRKLRIKAKHWSGKTPSEYVEPLETATDANSFYQVFMRTMMRINSAEETYYAR